MSALRKCGQIADPRVDLPEEAWRAISKFLLEQRTGNVQLNIKGGRVLGFHVNEIVSIPS